MKVVITGSAGLLGWHVACHVHARNCAARFAGDNAPFELVLLDRAAFNDDAILRQSLTKAALIVHCAGQNRGEEAEIEATNPALAERLVAFCAAAGVVPNIIYLNSIHATTDTAYGRSKRRAGEILSASHLPYTDIVLPHIFGEGARPNYNNVTATLVRHVIGGTRPALDPDGRVELLHAGAVARAVLDIIDQPGVGALRLSGRPMTVVDLFAALDDLHRSYKAEIMPALADEFAVALFNTYRSALYPGGFPRNPKLHDDARGRLFEAVKGGSGGQTFVSWTQPGAIRGNHFHLSKVERFLVLEGQATIRIRPALGSRIDEYHVSGAEPAIVDMPTLFTHSIENTGTSPMLTLFWTNEIFDPAAPDTYRDTVAGANQ